MSFEYAGKIYKKLLVNRLNKKIKEKKALSEDQHGFRTKVSTTTTILQLKDKIMASKNDSTP